MLRTLLALSATLLIGVATLYAVSGNSESAVASVVPCPCGQCDLGCTCCLDDNVSCGDCQCESCGCDACATASTSTLASAESCCSKDASSCCASKSTDPISEVLASTTVASDACPCGQCDVGCTCCVDDNVACEDCQCESCGCELCALGSESSQG